ncbi:hypothetical protein CI669_019490 [Escherichia coli]|nr:hypothetical protein CI669_019490 [Escherichia coli]
MDTPRPQLLDFQFHQNNDSFTLHFQQRLILTHSKDGNDSNLLIVFYVQIMPDDFVMQLHRF